MCFTKLLARGGLLLSAFLFISIFSLSLARADTRVHGLVFADLGKTTGTSTSLPNRDLKKILNGKTLLPHDLKRIEGILRELEVNSVPIRRLPLEGPILLDKKVLALPPSRNKFLSKSILLPDIELLLIDVKTEAIIVTTTSDVNGVFDLPEVPKGRYQLCWKGDGWRDGCQKDLIFAGDGPAYVLPIYIQPEEKKGFRTLAGRVLLKDKTPCRVFNWRHNLDFTAQVSSQNTVSQSVRANGEGYYVLPQVRAYEDKVNVSCGDSDADKIFKVLESKGRSNIIFNKADVDSVLANAPAATSVRVGANGSRVVNLTVDNSKPVVVDLSFATEFGSAGRGPAGSKVVITANVLDPDRLALFWVMPTNTAVADGDKIEWVAPKRPGIYRLSLFVGDGRGGWSSITKSFEVTPDPRLPFSGTVTLNGNPASIKSDVRASVNGQMFPLNKEGRFFGKIKPVENKRYIMNIEAPGMIPISRVFHRESTGGNYDLKPANTMTINPRRPHPIDLGQTKGADGSYVRLEPNSLVIEGTEQLATGPVTVTSSYLDPGAATLPGDYDAIGADGRTQSLISFGAAYLDFRDAQGRKLNLRKGMTAELVMRPAPNSVGSPDLLPSILPVWTYNMKTGFWDLEKNPATLVNGVYRTTTSHFSTVNLDLGSLGNSACVRVQLDFIHTPQARVLKVTTSNGLGGFQVKQVELDQRLNAVFRLLPLSTTSFEMLYPDNTPFTEFQLREVIGSNISDLDGTGGTVLNTITLQSGDEQQSPVDLWPNEPFTDCSRLLIASGDITSPSEFFTRKDAQTINQARSEAYYAFMDQTGERDNLEEWLIKNQFQPITSGGGFTFPPAAGVVELSYLNHGDLGSGRKMHCRKDAERVACIVGNYSANTNANFNRDPASGDTAHAAIMGTGFATVGMEYSAVDGAVSTTKVVKFFTYGTANNRARIFAAALEEDDTKARNLPELCQICHGGSLPSNFPATVANANNLFNGTQSTVSTIIDHFASTDPSSFREFDLNAFRNVQGSNPENKAKQLNCDYVLESNPISGIENLIKGWYSNACDSNSNFGINQPTFVPTAWQTNATDTDIYTNVVANVCRTCHIAQKGIDFTDPAGSGYNWNSAHSGDPFTCNISAAMPNAPIPFNSYWIEGMHDKMLAAYDLGNNGCP